jgi:hypothetical protein
MIKRYLPPLFTILSIAIPSAASAIAPIPDEEGFSGYLAIGAAGIKGESNMVAGNTIIDISHRTIYSLNDSPKSESDSTALLNGELAYTFSQSRTQIYVGNNLEDFLEFDFTTLFGLRHELSDKSLVAVSYVFNGISAEVWKDPYLTNQRRSKTDRESSGIRLEWDKIMGSQLGLQYTYRDIEIDDEFSGQSLGLNASDRSLLDREGDFHKLEASYNFNLQNGHFLKPKITYINRDLNGKAMRHDTWNIGFTHTYDTTHYAIVTSLEWATADYDRQNPIYNKTRDDDRWGIGLNAAYKNPFGYKSWNILASLSYYDSDSNIDFYDTNMKLISLSAVYRF